MTHNMVIRLSRSWVKALSYVNNMVYGMICLQVYYFTAVTHQHTFTYTAAYTVYTADPRFGFITDDDYFRALACHVALAHAPSQTRPALGPGDLTSRR